MLYPLERLISPDFWSDQIAAAFKAWAILFALALAFWAVCKIKLAKTNKEMLQLKAYKEAVESRLQLAHDRNVGEANTLAALRVEIDELRRLIRPKRKPQIDGDGPSKAKPSAVEIALKQVDASAATLAIANRTIDHILTAKKLAIADLDKKQDLELMPRPDPISRSGYEA